MHEIIPGKLGQDAFVARKLVNTVCLHRHTAIYEAWHAIRSRMIN